MSTDLVFIVVENNIDYYIELFLKAKQAVRSAATVEWYEKTLKYFRPIPGGDWPPRPHHLLAFFETFKTKQLAEASCDTYYRGLRGWLNWLHKNGFIPANPIEYVDGPRNPRLLPKAPPQTDVARLFSTVEQNLDSWQAIRDLALFNVALDTGARISELAALRLEDIDLTYGEIRVYGAKDKADRTLELEATAAGDLARWLKQRAELSAPRSLRSVWISDYQKKGLRPLTHWGMRLRLKFWQKRAEIKPFPFNGFRHAFAIYSLRNQADLVDIKDQMGHASIKTTAIYLEVVNEGRKERHGKTSPRKNLKA